MSREAHLCSCPLALLVRIGRLPQEELGVGKPGCSLDELCDHVRSLAQAHDGSVGKLGDRAERAVGGVIDQVAPARSWACLSQAGSGRRRARRGLCGCWRCNPEIDERPSRSPWRGGLLREVNSKTCGSGFMACSLATIDSVVIPSGDIHLPVVGRNITDGRLSGLRLDPASSFLPLCLRPMFPWEQRNSHGA